MNLLIIYTYPNRHSLNGAFLQSVIKGSKQNSLINELKVVDLYKEEFDPVLVFNEHKRRRDMHKDPSLNKYREQLLWADKIVFVYPIWWGRPPAMLLGYIDQLFASNFAYKDKEGLFPEGLLKGKSVVCISTMKGPTHYPFLWLNNAHKTLMKRALFQFVGIRKVKFFEFGFMEKSNGHQTKKLEKIVNYFKKVAY
ncbi:NAD(P)H-dependent oxidoreductase [Alkalicoccobacillus gibsonii]|uniref:NAD(P)H-dependent oxidoreductase n=1 Tax=Alkalicoccobacillus gibsonii TaxID=79881 RepID=A0ABU9VEA1_9BACI